jgi:hypothetical protein
MHFIILAIFLGLAAIIVWVADLRPSARSTRHSD